MKYALVLNLFELEARVFSGSVQNCCNMWSETSANYQQCYTITAGDCVFETAFSTALQLHILCGWLACRKEVFMCSSLNLKCFTFELNCGMLFFQFAAGTSKQQESSTICKSLDVSLERRETSDTVSRGTSSSYTETSYNSAEIPPVPPSNLPCTSSSRNKQIQCGMDDSAVALLSTRNTYTYKKISDLVEPEKKVNIYGVIRTIVKVKLILNLAYIVCNY